MQKSKNVKFFYIFPTYQICETKYLAHSDIYETDMRKGSDMIPPNYRLLTHIGLQLENDKLKELN